MKTKRMKLFGFIFIPMVLLSTSATKVRAHPADIYVQTIHITISETGLQINWEVKPGPMLSSFVWYQMDTDGNKTISTLEAESWGNAQTALLTATLNDTPLPLLTDSINLPASSQKFQSGEEFITFNLSADWQQDLVNTKNLTIHNELEQKTSINWFYLSTTGKASFTRTTKSDHHYRCDSKS
jgi:hypothetical protein